MRSRRDKRKAKRAIKKSIRVAKRKQKKAVRKIKKTERKENRSKRISLRISKRKQRKESLNNRTVAGRVIGSLGNMAKATQDLVQDAGSQIKDTGIFKIENLLETKNKKLINLRVKKIINSLKDSDKPTSLNIYDNIFYINGLDTDEKKLEKNLKIVSKYFSTNIRAIYNPTEGPLKDLKESIKDYTWGVKTTKNNSIDDIKLNDTVYEIIAILEIAKSKELPLGIIASSQGTLISYNAILAFSLLSSINKEYLKNYVRVCHLAIVLPKFNESKMSILLNKYKAITNKKDPVAMFVGLKAPLKIALLFSGPSIKYHYLKWYLPTEDNKEVMEEYKPETEPFVRKDFFISPVFNYLDNNKTNNWLVPFLFSTMN